MDNTPVRDKEFYLTSGRKFTDKNGHFNRRTEFRKYLDRTGVLDKLTEIFMDLYENPVINFPVVEFVRKRLVQPNTDDEQVAILRSQLEESKSFREFLAKENRHLKTLLKNITVAEPESPPDDNE